MRYFLLIPLLFLLLANLPSWQAPHFSLDDPLLLNLPQLETPVTLASLKSIFTVGSNVDFYPVRDLTYLADKVFWPDSLAAARLQQLLWFALLAFFAYASLLQLGAKKEFALLGVSLWILLPYHAEMLFWIAARKDILAMCFAVMSFYFFLQEKKKYLFLSLVFFLLSLLSKATFSLAPLALAPIFWKKIFSRAQITTAASLILLGIVSVFFQRWFYSRVNPIENTLPLALRLSSSMSALGREFLGLFLPKLNIVDTDNYGEWLAQNRSFAFGGMALFFLYLYTLVRACWQKKEKSMSGLLLLGLLYLPVSNLLFAHREFYSVRYFEPCVLVLGGFLVFYLSTISTIKRQKLAAGILCLLLVQTAYFSYREGKNWQSGLAVREKALSAAPKSLTQKSYLLGELLPLKTESAQKQLLVAELEERCSTLEKSGDPAWQNCNIFYRYAWMVNRTNPARADFYSQKLLATLALFHPIPKAVQRFSLENELGKGIVDHERLQAFLRQNPYLPIPEYRALHLAALCFTDETKVKSEWTEMRSARLLTEKNMTDFLELLAPTLQQRLRSCLSMR